MAIGATPTQWKATNMGGDPGRKIFWEFITTGTCVNHSRMGFAIRMYIVENMTWSSSQWGRNNNDFSISSRNENQIRYITRIRTKNAMYLEDSSWWPLRDKISLKFISTMKQSNKKVMEKNRRLLILCPYPKGCAGSQRFRFEQYVPFLEANNILVDQQSFLTEWGWGVVYKKGTAYLRYGPRW